MNSQILDPVGNSPATAPLVDAITDNLAVGSRRRLLEKEVVASHFLDGEYIAFEHRDGPLPDAGQLEPLRTSCRCATPGGPKMVDQVRKRLLGRSAFQIAGVFMAALFCLATAVAPSSRADEAADLATVRKQLQELQENVRSLEAQQPPSSAMGPVERFDGKWEGKIIGDKRYDCRDGELRATVRAGQLEGSRWFFSGNVAPIKGKIQADGSYEGIQNRVSTAGRFTEDAAELWYVKPDGSCENKLFMRKVAPL